MSAFQAEERGPTPLSRSDMGERIIPFNDLAPSNQEPLQGKDKIVYRVSDGSMVMAAKIFKNQDSFGQDIDKDQRARQEFEDYQTLIESGSDLRSYVPQPLFLLSDDKGEVSGFAAEWLAPNSLADVDVHEDPLTEADLKALKSSIVGLAHQGIGLDPDMLSDWNIGFDPSRKPPIYLFECNLYPIESMEQYLSLIDRQFIYFKAVYCS